MRCSLRWAVLTAAFALVVPTLSHARFLQTDPVGYQGNIDPYTYVQNDPTDNTDPSGQMCDGIGACDSSAAKGSAVLGNAIGNAVAHHPGETMQVVGAGISMIPAPQAKAAGGAIGGAGTVVRALDGENAPVPATEVTTGGRPPGPTIDRATGRPVGRIVGDSKGNNMIEPEGGRTVQGPKPSETHTTYPNGSNYQRFNPQGHATNPVGHGHGHLEGPGPDANRTGQGPSIDNQGNVVPSDSPEAHWPINQ